MIRLSLRPAQDSDREWVWETKKRCLKVYVTQTFGVWNEETQSVRFKATFEAKEVKLIHRSGQRVGYVAFESGETELRLFNLMILPEFQNQGLGTAILKKLQAEAKEKRIPLTLQVLKVNPARQLYERLGFSLTETTDTHFRLQWMPPT